MAATPVYVKMQIIRECDSRHWLSEATAQRLLTRTKKKSVCIDQISTSPNMQTSYLSSLSPGARVILACRDMARGEQAARDIMREVTGAKVVARQLDLADTKSICQFAENIYNSGWQGHTRI